MNDEPSKRPGEDRDGHELVVYRLDQLRQGQNEIKKEVNNLEEDRIRPLEKKVTWNKIVLRAIVYVVTLIIGSLIPLFVKFFLTGGL